VLLKPWLARLRALPAPTQAQLAQAEVRLNALRGRTGGSA
jgi:hypothetical protein